MRQTYHLPAEVTGAEDLPATGRERLASVVLDAVARAVRAAAPADRTVVAVPDRPPAREAFAPHRVSAGAYGVPSYDAEGRPVDVPLRGGSVPFRVRVTRPLGSGELLREFVRQYREVAGAEAGRLLGTEHWHWTGPPPEVTAADLARGYKVLRVVDHSLRLIDALPTRIRDFLFTAGARPAGPADYPAVLRLARRLAALSDEELAGYRAKVGGHTTDWGVFEESVDRYLAEVRRFQEGAVRVESAKTALYGMEGLYALYKEWKAPRSPAAARFGMPAARPKDAEFRAALAAHHVASPEAFEALIAGFLAAFEDQTVLIGLDLLARYDHLLTTEQERLQAPGAADRLVAALAATPARTLYAEAADKAAGARAIRPDPELHRYVGDEYALKSRWAAEAARARAAADELVTAAAASPAIAEAGFDRAALARATSAAEALRVVSDHVAEHRHGIAVTRANLTGDRAFGYDLPLLLAASMRQQDIRPGTVYHEIVTDRIGTLRARKVVTGIVLAVVTIAISVATAGTGTAAVLGAAAVFGLGAWQAVQAYQEYARGHAAHQAGLVDEDPWFGWVVVAAAGAGVDLGGLAAAIRPVEPALKAFKATGDVARLAAELKAAGIAERLAAGIVAEARATTSLTAALRDLSAAAGRFGMVVAGVEGFGAAVRVAYFAARQGIVSLDRFVLRLRAARLVAEGELGAEDLARLRVLFEEAGAAGRRMRALGAELGLSEEQLAAVVEAWGANPAWTLAQVEGELRAVVAGSATLSRPLVRQGLRFRFQAAPAAWRALDTMPAGYAVYLVRDAGGRVIYVGITGRPGWVRWTEHLADKSGEWLGQASRFEFTAVGLDTEKLALALEHDLMRELAPPFNRQWTYLERFGGPPAAVDIPSPNARIVLDLVHE